jgi:hypothetical protein
MSLTSRFFRELEEKKRRRPRPVGVRKVSALPPLTGLAALGPSVSRNSEPATRARRLGHLSPAPTPILILLSSHVGFAKDHCTIPPVCAWAVVSPGLADALTSRTIRLSCSMYGVIVRVAGAQRSSSASTVKRTPRFWFFVMAKVLSEFGTTDPVHYCAPFRVIRSYWTRAEATCQEVLGAYHAQEERVLKIQAVEAHFFHPAT